MSKHNKTFHILSTSSAKNYFLAERSTIDWNLDKDKNTIKKYPLLYQKASYEPFWINLPEREEFSVKTDLISYWTLTDRKLTFRRSGRKKMFWLNQIAYLNLKFKRLMLPLLIGGVGGVFALVASLRGVFNWWIGVSLVAVGMLLFYYGMKGKYQMEIFLKNKVKHTFFIEETDKKWDIFYQRLNELWRRA